MGYSQTRVGRRRPDPFSSYFAHSELNAFKVVLCGRALEESTLIKDLLLGPAT